MRWAGAVLALCCLFPRPSGGEVLSAAASVQVYDREGRPLRSFLSEQNTYFEPVPLADMSAWVVLAAVAAEDRRFYTHPGLDVRAVLRAAGQNSRGGGVVSGASTITQQLARALHPRPKTWRGKWTEAVRALKLERRFSKEAILEQYLNILEFGNQTQGVQAAARFYFGVSAAELSLAQSALLAGLIQSPSRLNPLKNPRGAMGRRSRVLDAMQKNGFITPEEYRLAMLEPLGLTAGQRPFSAPHFVRKIHRLAPQAGVVHTLLDADLQTYAEQTVQKHVRSLAGYHVTQGAVVVLDNATGGVLAYVGSADFWDKAHSGEVDGVSARRQPGSALKPFVYALALQNGYTAATLLQDEDTFFEGGFRPRNYDKTFHGRVPLRRALACSYNVPVIKVAEPLGAARILQMLHAFGFASLNRAPEFYGLGLALGGGEVTLLELANAYAALARGGVIKPVLLALQPRLQTDTPTVRVLPPEESYIITDILADNTARADAFGVNSPLQFAFPAAAKTGTSKDYKDNFAIGYTPRVTVAVWAGNFDASPMQKVSGITGAAPMMHDVLAYAAARYPAGEFARPAEVISAQICSHSGLLAGPACGAVREEIFTADTVPTQVCDGQHEAQARPAQILFPVPGDVLVYDPALPPAGQQVHMRTAGLQAPCVWHINGRERGETGTEFWWPLEKGRFDVHVSCGGNEARSFFTVL